MLASLLAKQPANNQPIPPVPAHVITATPQEKLPKIADVNKAIQQQMGVGQVQSTQSQQQQQQNSLIVANSRLGITR